MTRKSRKTETGTERAGCLEGGASFLPSERLIANGTADPVGMGIAVSDWYHADHRKLPWRGTRDPYRILVSEIMLQQTRVETVTGYWNRFLEAFPDAAALADAEPEQVMNLWQGLGYYSRGRNLQKAAKMVMGEFSRSVPGQAGEYPQVARRRTLHGRCGRQHRLRHPGSGGRRECAACGRAIVPA